MERMSTQTMVPRKVYAAPRLKLYGSVLALTAAGTGALNETGMSTGTMNCYDGMTPGMWATRKHCV